MSSGQVEASSNWIVECKNNARCETKSPNQPLFSEPNFIPGQVVQTEILIKNRSKETCLLTLRLQQKSSTRPDFADHFFTAFYDINNYLIPLEADTYELPLTALLSGKVIGLGAVAQGSTAEFVWQIRLSSQLENEFQAQALSFDTDLIFECDASFEQFLPVAGRSVAMVLAVQPTATPTCQQQAPDTAVPELIIISENRSEEEVKLAWNSEDGKKYLLEFGPVGDKSIFRHGGISTGQKRVDHLDPARDYWFLVREQQGCALGPQSNVVYVWTVGKSHPIPTITLAQNQNLPLRSTGEVLGVETDKTGGPPLDIPDSAFDQPQPEVETSSLWCTQDNSTWWIKLLQRFICWVSQFLTDV